MTCASPVCARWKCRARRAGISRWSVPGKTARGNFSAISRRCSRAVPCVQCRALPAAAQCRADRTLVGLKGKGIMAETIKLDGTQQLDFDRATVEQAYDRWAPVYDLVFGGVFSKG